MDRESQILIVSCGPGYLVDLLREQSYRNVHGIDSDPKKIDYAIKRGLNCRVANAFPFLREREAVYDLILCEQELNHLTKEEMMQFLHICSRSLKPGCYPGRLRAQRRQPDNRSQRRSAEFRSLQHLHREQLDSGVGAMWV